MMINSLATAWNKMALVADEELTLADIGVTLSGDAMYLAMDNDGSRHLLLPAPDKFERQTLESERSLQVTTRRVNVGGHEALNFLDIFCIDSRSFPVFDELVYDVYQTAKTESDPVNSAEKRLALWSELFKVKSRRTLSARERIGIYAELSVLLDFLMANATVDTTCWTGPSGAPHDFEFETMSLEVKAYGTETDLITFHGAQQLESSDGKELFLCLRKVSEDPEGTTIPELAEEIAEAVANDLDIRSKLNRLGVHADDKALSTIRYAIERESILPVDEQTPRIVASSFISGKVPEEISRLQYSIAPRDLFREDAHANISTLIQKRHQ